MSIASIQPVAAIGIGSNSIRLLVAMRAQSDSAVRLSALERLETVTRLSEYKRKTGDAPVLTARTIKDTLAVASDYAHYATERGAPLLGVLATEALRSAANATDLIDALERQLDIPVTVLSGPEEADLGWRAVSSAYAELGTHLGVIDLGGASTDLSVGWSGASNPHTVASVPIGARTLMGRFGLQAAVEPYEVVNVMSDLLMELVPQAMALHPPPQAAVVIGGTASVLAYVHRGPAGEKLPGEHTALDRDWLEGWLERMASLNAVDRAILGIPRDRADVIVAGGIILMSLLNAWNLGQFYASERNILDGFVERSISGVGVE